MVFFLNMKNAQKLGRMMQDKFNIEKDPGDLDKGCINWKLFEESEDFEPFKRFLPKSLPTYYAEGNADYEKQLCVEHSIEQGKTTQEIEEECDVNSKDIEEYVKINRIIEELDDIEELIKN